MQRAQDEVRRRPGVHVGPLRGEQPAQVRVPDRVDGLVLIRGAILGRDFGRVSMGQLAEQALVAGDRLDDRVEEGEQPVPVRRARPQRRGPVRYRLRERPGALVHEGAHQACPAAEAVKDGPLPHARLGRDLLHGDVPRAVRRQQLLRGLEDRAPVPRGVRALLAALAHLVPHPPVDKLTIGPVTF